MSNTPTLRPAGERGVLAEVSDNAAVHALAAAVRDRFGARLEDVVPGANTVLMRFAQRPPALAAVAAELAELGVDARRPADSAAPTTISVRYDGVDLDVVAARLGIDADDVVALHAAPLYTVAFMGFAPGFAYLIGGDPRLHLPRRDEPRARVPAGSVAIAGTYSAVYPMAAPGGWHLLGQTDATLFDAAGRPPARLEAGSRVAFEPL